MPCLQWAVGSGQWARGRQTGPLLPPASLGGLTRAAPLFIPMLPLEPHISRLWGNCLRWVGGDRLTPSSPRSIHCLFSLARGGLSALMAQDRPH